MTGLGDQLKAARAARGLSLQSAADAATISVGYLHKLEAGRVGSPSPRVLQRLAGVTEVPYWTLMELAGYLEPGTPPPPAGGRPAETDPEPPTNAQLVGLLEAVREDVAALARRVEQALERV